MSMRWASLPTGTQDRQAARGTDTAGLGRAFEAVRAGLGAGQGFPRAAVAEAQAVVAAPALCTRDETSLPLLSIGRPGGLDLDQALLIERAGTDFRVRYATADVTACGAPGGDRRGVAFQGGFPGRARVRV